MHADVQLLSELGLLLGVATLLAVMFARLNIPSVVAYLATGALLGPPGLGLFGDAHHLGDLAEVGVVLLLFTIGLEFDLGSLRRSWRGILLGGGLQVLGTIALVAAAVLLFGGQAGVAVTWGMVVALSSTAVVLRLLEDRGETRSALGRLVTGVLIFQDLCIVPMVMMLPVLAGGSGGGVGLVWALLESVAVVAGVLVASRVVVPPLLGAVARDTPREVFLLAVLAVGGLVSWAVSLTGLSFALGAFLAGVVLAETQYSHQALTDVLPLRAVMMCVFFVGIGMLIDLQTIASAPGLVFGLFLGIGVVKLAVAVAVFVLLRFPVPLAVLAAASLAQVGEFSLVLAGTAQELGLLTVVEERAFLAAAVLSILVTPLVTARAPHLVQGSRAVRAASRLLDGSDGPPLAVSELPDTPHVIVAGLGVGGRAVVEALERAGVGVTVIELNPDTVTRERARGRQVLYGDIGSEEVQRHAGLSTARAVVLTVSDFEAAHHAALQLKRARPDLPVLLRTRWASEEGALRNEGLEVVSEEFAGAVTMASLVLRQLDVASWDAILDQQLREHQGLAPGDEGGLGPPPAGGAARHLSTPSRGSGR